MHAQAGPGPGMALNTQIGSRSLLFSIGKPREQVEKSSSVRKKTSSRNHKDWNASQPHRPPVCDCGYSVSCEPRNQETKILKPIKLIVSAKGQHCKTRTVESKEKSFECSKVCGASRIEGFLLQIDVGTATQTAVRRNNSTGSMNL